MKFSTILAVSAACATSAEAAALHFLGRLARDSPDVGVHVDLEVVKEEGFKTVAHDECVCPEGTFWHYRIKQCVAKGGIGYECGFFPAEHHDDVCADGLTCKKLKTSPIKYFHAGAVPATCLKCEASDNCKKSTSDNCAKVVELAGEACATVRAKARPEQAVAETESDAESATGKFTAKADATATFGEGDRAVSKTASAECTESAEVSAKGSATAVAKAEASQEKTVCVSIIDALTRAGHSKDLKFSESIADEVKEVGKTLALEQAKAEAKKAAAKHSLKESEDEAEQEAKKLAKQRATAEAEKEAAAKAKAKAEACAAENAKIAAEAAAKAAYLKQPVPTQTTTSVPSTTAPAATTTKPAATTTEPAATTTQPAATTAEPAASTTEAPAAKTTEAPQKPGPLLRGAPPKMVMPAPEPVVEPVRKVSKEEAAANLP